MDQSLETLSQYQRQPQSPQSLDLNQPPEPMPEPVPSNLGSVEPQPQPMYPDQNELEPAQVTKLSPQQAQANQSPSVAPGLPNS